MGFTPLLEMIFVSHIFRCERRFEGSNRGCKGDSKAQIGNEDNMHLWGWGIFSARTLGAQVLFQHRERKRTVYLWGLMLDGPFSVYSLTHFFSVHFMERKLSKTLALHDRLCVHR